METYQIVTLCLAGLLAIAWAWNPIKNFFSKIKLPEKKVEQESELQILLNICHELDKLNLKDQTTAYRIMTKLQEIMTLLREDDDE